MVRAGRALDALLAKKVMGWQKYDKEVVSKSDPEDRMLVPVWLTSDGRELMAALLPEFSTDMRAAWLVVEKVRTFNKGDEEGLEVSVIALLDHYDCHVETNTAAYLAIAEADTAPLAICRAALMVVGE